MVINIYKKRGRVLVYFLLLHMPMPAFYAPAACYPSLFFESGDVSFNGFVTDTAGVCKLLNGDGTVLLHHMDGFLLSFYWDIFRDISVHSQFLFTTA